MSVDPGFKGGQVVPSIFGKIKDAKKLLLECGLDIEIALDGNVSFENIPKMVAAGADTLILGSSGLFVKGLSLDDSIKLVNEAIKQGLGVINE